MLLQAKQRRPPPTSHKSWVPTSNVWGTAQLLFPKTIYPEEERTSGNTSSSFCNSGCSRWPSDLVFGLYNPSQPQALKFLYFDKRSKRYWDQTGQSTASESDLETWFAISFDLRVSQIILPWCQPRGRWSIWSLWLIAVQIMSMEWASQLTKNSQFLKTLPSGQDFVWVVTCDHPQNAEGAQFVPGGTPMAWGNCGCYIVYRKLNWAATRPKTTESCVRDTPFVEEHKLFSIF